MRRALAPVVTLVAIEARAGYGNDVNGETTFTMFRPAGTRIDNDGVTVFWMDEGETFTLAHDGTGWTVVPARFGRWADNHTRRLASEHGPLGESFIGWLPGRDGQRIELDPAKIYTLSLTQHSPGEGVYASGELSEVTGTAL